MPQKFEIGQGATALEFNLFTQIGSYGRIDGVGVTLGGSTSSIELDVEPGTILHDDDIVSVSAQTVTLQQGDPQNPRKDVVWIDYEGSARVRAGVPAAPDPPGEKREDTWQPAPPPGTALDGVPLAEVWVPAGATETGDLQEADVVDRRIDAVNKSGRIRELASDPADSNLVKSQLWRNITANELRAYFSDTDEVRSIDTTLVRSLSGPTEKVIEDFDDSISANWSGGDSSFDYNTPAFEGDNAAEWTGPGITRDVSVPGDGLTDYPESGDTISLAVRDVDSSGYAYFSFAKESDVAGENYRLSVSGSGDLELEKRGANDTLDTTLGSTSFSFASGTWYVIEVEYDGGGNGVHPFRVYSTSGGSRDTVLAEELSPTQDTTYRGRGLEIGGDIGFRIDRLGLIPA